MAASVTAPYQSYISAKTTNDIRYTDNLDETVLFAQLFGRISTEKTSLALLSAKTLRTEGGKVRLSVA